MKCNTRRFPSAFSACLLIGFVCSSCALLPRKPGFIPAPPISSVEPVKASSSTVDAKGDKTLLSAESSALLKAGKFEELNAKMDSARSSRERLPGGMWKLWVYYNGIETPNFEQNASESEWRQHLSRLRTWKEKMPDSITARVALAQALIAYGFEARGGDFINKVSDENIKLFMQRVDDGLDELVAAKALGTKCPQWYAAMLNVGLAQSWEGQKYESIFEEGFKLEPTYYHLAREKVHYLLPQWFGRQGDVAKFVDSTSKRIGGDEGDIMYFELASTLQPNYRGELWMRTGLEWARAKTGYEAMKRIYGVDRYRKNLFMYFSFHSNAGTHIASLEAAVGEVGNDCDPDVWGTCSRFEEIRTTIGKLRDQEKALMANRPGGASNPPPPAVR